MIAIVTYPDFLVYLHEDSEALRFLLQEASKEAKARGTKHPATDQVEKILEHKDPLPCNQIFDCNAVALVYLEY